VTEAEPMFGLFGERPSPIIFGRFRTNQIVQFDRFGIIDQGYTLVIPAIASI